jgi:preprotein translocase SecE subunit
MAVLRSRKGSTPSDVVPSGEPGSTPPPPADRTRSVVDGRKTEAGRSALDRPAPRGPAARPGAAGAQVGQGSVRSLISDTRAELNRVVWPTLEEVRSGTIVTIGLLIFFGLYIFVLDYAAEWLFHAMGMYARGSGAG